MSTFDLSFVGRFVLFQSVLYRRFHCHNLYTSKNSSSLPLLHTLTITPKNIIEIVQVKHIRRVRIVSRIRRLHFSGIIQVCPVPTSIAAAPEDLVIEELHAYDGKGIVDDADEEEHAEETRGEGHHRVHQVSIAPLQTDQSVRERNGEYGGYKRSL